MTGDLLHFQSGEKSEIRMRNALILPSKMTDFLLVCRNNISLSALPISSSFTTLPVGSIDMIKVFHQTSSSRIFALPSNVFVNYVYACVPTGKNLLVQAMHYKYKGLYDA